MFGFQKRQKEALTNRVNQLEARCIDLLERQHTLMDENEELRVKNKKLSQTKQMEEEMIAHKLKMREESIELAADKRIAEAEQKATKAKVDGIAKAKDDYRDKLENQLETRGDELKEMYTEVLARLPDISMAITKDIKEKK